MTASSLASIRRRPGRAGRGKHANRARPSVQLLRAQLHACQTCPSRSQSSMTLKQQPASKGGSAAYPCVVASAQGTATCSKTHGRIIPVVHEEAPHTITFLAASSPWDLPSSRACTSGATPPAPAQSLSPALCTPRGLHAAALPPPFPRPRPLQACPQLPRAHLPAASQQTPCASLATCLQTIPA